MYSWVFLRLLQKKGVQKEMFLIRLFHQVKGKRSMETKESASRCQCVECFLYAHPTIYQSKPSMTISSGSITSMDAQTNFGHSNNDFSK